MTVADKSVLLISSDRSVNDAIGSALSGLKGLHLQTEPSTLAGLNGKAVQLAKGRDVIIFETGGDADGDLEAVRALKAAGQVGGLLLALVDSDTPLSRVRALNEAGVDDVVSRSDAGSEIGGRVRKLFRAATSTGPREPIRKGHIIAVARARGGVGGTTLAVNLANNLVGTRGFLRNRALNQVALVDLDVQFGSVGALLDLGEQDTLLQLALDGAEPDPVFLNQVMAVLPNGLKVLAAPSKFMPLDSLRPAQITAILEGLCQDNDYVVVDLPHALGGWMEPVLRLADELIIVSDTSVPSVRHCRRLIEFVASDNSELKIRVVINREARSLFSKEQKAIQKALDRKLDHWLPLDIRAAKACADHGKPLASVAPRSSLGKAISKLARQTIAEFPTRPVTFSRN